MAELQLDDRQTRLLEWSKAGSKPSVIADQLKMTEQEVIDEVAALLLLKHPGLDREKAMELERLDTLNRALWAKVLKGDVSSVSRALEIHDRRVELLGNNRESTPATELQDDMDALMRRSLERSNALRSGGDTPNEPPDPKE